MPAPRCVCHKMKLMWVLFVCVLAVSIAGETRAVNERTYPYLVDDAELTRVLSSRRLVALYVHCLLGRKRCPPQGIELKRHLPEVLATRCSKCTTAQREAAVRIIRVVRTEYPDLWSVALQQWDPTGQLLRRFELAVKRTVERGGGA